MNDQTLIQILVLLFIAVWFLIFLCTVLSPIDYDGEEYKDGF